MQVRTERDRGPRGTESAAREAQENAGEVPAVPYQGDPAEEGPRPSNREGALSSVVQGTSCLATNQTLAGRSARRRRYHWYQASPYAIRSLTWKPSLASRSC